MIFLHLVWCRVSKAAAEWNTTLEPFSENNLFCHYAPFNKNQMKYDWLNFSVLRFRSKEKNRNEFERIAYLTAVFSFKDPNIRVPSWTRAQTQNTKKIHSELLRTTGKNFNYFWSKWENCYTSSYINPLYLSFPVSSSTSSPLFYSWTPKR